MPSTEKSPHWTGRESSALEYLRLRREQEGDLAERAQALIAENARLLDELRNPTGDGHRYGHASEDEITANQLREHLLAAPDGIWEDLEC